MNTNVDIEGLESLQLDFVVDKFLLDIARRIVNTIKINTSDGIDVNGQALFPNGYSDAYREYREKIGRNPDGDWLFLTGQMLRSMTYAAADNNTVIVGFDGIRTMKAPKVQKHTYKRGAKKGQTEYRAKQNTVSNVSMTNAEVAYHIDQDHEFFGISEDNLDGILENAINWLEIK